MEVDPDASAYGLFMAGSAAEVQGDGDVASSLFERASAAEDGDAASVLKGRAFMAAVEAGDLRRADDLGARTEELDPRWRYVALMVDAVRQMADGHGREALSALDKLAASGGSTEPLVVLLTPFAAAAVGDTERAFAMPALRADPATRFQIDLDQGWLYERAGKLEQAETDYRALIGRGDRGWRASLALGRVLERRGKGAEALAIYRRASVEAPDDPMIQAALRRVQAHKSAPRLPGLNDLASRALMTPSIAMVNAKQGDAGLIYLRLALMLDPANDAARLVLGDAFTDEGRDEEARDAWASVPETSEYYTIARLKLTLNLESHGQKAQALEAARALAGKAPANREASITLATTLQSNGDFEGSRALLDRMMAAEPHPDWRLMYLQANNLAELNRWPEAEALLRGALKVRPDEPDLLNFLGFSWISRGEHLEDAIGMVSRAVALKPDSAAMIDSLGWGYFKQGDYNSAIIQLEKAVSLDPGEPDINDHLGDAYFRAGRTLEATYRWKRVLTLDPDEKLKAAVEAKLARGLEPMPKKVAALP